MQRNALKLRCGTGHRVWVCEPTERRSARQRPRYGQPMETVVVEGKVADRRASQRPPIYTHLCGALAADSQRPCGGVIVFDTAYHEL